MPTPRFNNGEQMDRMAQVMRIKVERVVRAVMLEALKRIVMRTPVLDGHARANWFVTFSNPSSDMTDATDMSGAKAISDGTALIGEFELGWKLYITNNLPYIGVLEYGGYPIPVKRGTDMSQHGGSGYEIRSEAGFSKQAPHGMIRVTVAELKAMLPEAVAAVQANNVTDYTEYQGS
jgi:hypothetical protein